MMAEGLNKVMLFGNLGADPELRTTQGGTAVMKLRLATTERYKDNDGQWQDRTEWHRLVVWNKQAEIAAEYLKKGAQIFVEGKLQTRSWEKDGQKHYMTEIVVLNFQMLGRKSDGGAESPAPSDEQAPPVQDGGGELPF